MSVDNAAATLSHYLRFATSAAGHTWNSDNDTEITDALNAIVYAAVEQALARMKGGAAKARQSGFEPDDLRCMVGDHVTDDQLSEWLAANDQAIYEKMTEAGYDFIEALLPLEWGRGAVKQKWGSTMAIEQQFHDAGDVLRD